MKNSNSCRASEREIVKWRLVLSCCLVAILTCATHAQVRTGTPPFGSFAGGPDMINLSNLNVSWSFPIISKAGRGMPFGYSLVYNSSIWTPQYIGTTLTWQPDSNWGWNNQNSAATGTLIYYEDYNEITSCIQYDTWTYIDSSGTSHSFNGYFNTCGQPSDTLNTSDGSGYSLTWALSGAFVLYSRSGENITWQPDRFYVGYHAARPGPITDTNGNQISLGVGSFTDTLGSTVLTVSGTNPVTYTYYVPNNPPSNQASVTVNYWTYSIKTNFNAPGIAEYTGSAQLVHNIVYPDGSSYTFSYENTPNYPGYSTGRIASVTLPTGGSITYNYHYPSGYNGIWADGSTAGFDRVLNDGTNSNTWSYDVNNSTHVDTVTDPSGNQMLAKFFGFYETKREIYQGSAVPANLLKTIVTCYNGVGPSGPPYNWDPCINATVTAPITTQVIFPILPNGSTQFYKWSAVVNTFNGAGLLTQSNEYDWTTGASYPPLRQTQISYASLGNNILDRPSSVVVLDGNNTTIAQTNFYYDQWALVSTSGTPQHIAVSGSRGNLTSMQLWTGGTNWLSHNLDYYDTGTIHIDRDVNGQATTYNYADTTSTCGNSFPTSVNLPPVAGITLTTSSTWSCSGGVVASTTDANGQSSSVTAWDTNFWRPTTLSTPFRDGWQNATSISYVPASASPFSPAATESTLNFNGTYSTVDTRTTLDGLGRTHILQQKQSPAATNWDSVETDYDSNGRIWRTTMPYIAAMGQSFPAGTPFANTNTYDPLNRLLSVLDSGGGTVGYTYNLNDVLVTTGPTPSGENAKQRQYEYDALGRLSSVCEVITTTGIGRGTCGQANPLTGYWTKYTYDTVGNLTGVTQNAQTNPDIPVTQQTRTFNYDRIGRLSSEANPETGTTNYTYDTDATCGTYTGDQVKRVDNAGNVTCYAYDVLHRVTSITYPSGPNATVTPSKVFLYDAYTYQSTPMANAKGRLVNTHTCWPASCSTSWLTSALYSYSPRGEVTDYYEATPNSGGAYHLTQNYWNHGSPGTLSGLPGLPSITYGAFTGNGGLDGEGRVIQVTASSGQNPVTNAVYNTDIPFVSGQPTGVLKSVTFGSNDSDSFSYEFNTARMYRYQFNVNSQTDQGTMTWNSNGSLQQLQISDNLVTPSVNQTCNYTHDDLGRIGTANCGPIQNQSFSYDPFGNMKKTTLSGVGNFQVNFDQATNHIQDVAYSYDGDGCLLNDGTGTGYQYTWDAEGRMLSVTSGMTVVNLTYDALGRMVEQQRGSSYTQLVYGPTGNKLALMNGQSLVRAYVPLPGGATAVYNSSGLAYYRHADWLGSSRLASTPARGVYYDTSYAPYGENYGSTGATDVSFTGQDQDTIGGLYDFMYRRHSPGQGRWISPDPAGLGAVDPNDPQSWNRYGYVSNRSLTSTDPLGLVSFPGNDCMLDVHGNCGGGVWHPGLEPRGSGWLNPYGLLREGAVGIEIPGWRYDREDGWVWGSWGSSQWSPHALSGTSGIPISEDCRAALGSRGTGGVRRAQANWSAIHNAASAHGIEPRILAAIGVRETNFQNITGDHGHGHGVFQFDDRYNSANVIKNVAYDIPKAADLAAAKITGTTNKYMDQGYDYYNSTAAAIREYNGTGGISTNLLLDTGYPGYISLGTTGNDYVKDVIGIAVNCF